jgi:hypothetical protein
VRRRPSRDGRHFVGVHSHPIGGDDVAEVGDRCRPERALRALKVKMMRSKLVEDDGDMLKVLHPRSVVDKYIMKENEHKPA